MSDNTWVYESPDGGSTIYRRPLGQPAGMRELHKELFPNEMRENQLWRDIRELAKTNETLNNALEEVKILYKLIASDDDNKNR